MWITMDCVVILFYPWIGIPCQFMDISNNWGTTIICTPMKRRISMWVRFIFNIIEIRSLLIFLFPNPQLCTKVWSIQTIFLSFLLCFCRCSCILFYSFSIFTDCWTSFCSFFPNVFHFKLVHKLHINLFPYVAAPVLVFYLVQYWLCLILFTSF